MPTVDSYFQDIGIHSLDLLAENDSNVATFGSITNSSLINFYTNIDSTNYYTIGMSNSSFVIRENTDDNGLFYNDELLRVDNLKTFNVNLDNLTYNTSQVIHPDSNIDINSYIFSTSGSVGEGLTSNIFDYNHSTYWRSENIFDGTGNLNFALNLPVFNNIYVEPGSLDSSKQGCWITVKLPMSIIVTKFHVQAVNFYLQFAPTHFILFGYDYVLKQWRLLREVSYFGWNTNTIDLYINIEEEKQFLYDQFTLFVNQVNGGLYAQIAGLELFGKPIISINNSLRISENSIYNVDTLVTRELRLSTDSITSFEDMINSIAEGAIITVESNITLNWSNLGDNSNTFAFKNVGINTAYPSASLNVIGDVSYNNRIIENYLSLYPHPELIILGNTIPLQRYSSQYIKVGSLSFITNEYFNFDLYSIDIPVDSTDYPFSSYSQKLTIYGICNPNIANIYYDQEINRTNIPIDTEFNTKVDRIIDFTYYYVNNNTLEFHVKFNNNLKINSFTSPKHFSNVLYLDFVNTKSVVKNNFTFPTTVEYPTLGATPLNATKISEKIIDEDELIDKDLTIYGRIKTNILTIDDIYFNSYSSNTVIYTDEYGIIKPTQVSKAHVDRIDHISTSSNYVIITNSEGFLTASPITTTLLYGLSNIANSSNKIIKTDESGVLTFTDITDIQLGRLNNTTLGSNNILITDESGLITYSIITDNELLGLSNVLYSSNKVIITNERGVLIPSIVDDVQLNRLYSITYSSNKVLYTDDSGLITYSPVTLDMLVGLSNIKDKPQKFIVTDENGYLKATDITAINSANLDNILTLFDFSNEFAYTYSNIVIGSNIGDSAKLYVSGNISTDNLLINDYLTIYNGIVRWNDTNSLFEYNNESHWKQFGENIITSLCKYPPTSLYVITNIFNVSKNQTVYTLNLNNNDNYGNGDYIIKVDTTDDDIDNRNVYNIFNDKPLNNFWKSANNFDSSGPTGYGNTRYIDQNSTDYINTASGAYIVIKIPEKILLSHYILYYKYDNNSPYKYENTLNSFNIFGYDSENNYWNLIDQRTNITNWNNNFRPNIFHLNDIYNNKRYNTFAICILKTNTSLDNNFAVLNGLELYGNNNYYGNILYNVNSNLTTNNNSNIYTKLYTSEQTVLLGYNNVGINNYFPNSLLSIGEDIYTSNYLINNEPVLSLNHSCNVDNYYNDNGIKILNLTRPSEYNTRGIRASHILNTWVNNSNDIRTRYDINLSHKYYENENLVLSLLSDGRVGIGMTPDNSNYLQPHLSVLSNIHLYNNNDTNENIPNNFISIGVHNVNSNYNIILPENIGNQYDFLHIKEILNDDVDEGHRLISTCLEWVAPNSIFDNVNYAKIGYQTLTTCNIDPIKLQVAGHCIIGSNYLNDVGTEYLNDNALIVTGQIYTTHDVTTDSDMSYKYDLSNIENPIEKIKQLNGYTFLRNDVLPNQKDKRFCGLIAQEVDLVMPEAVSVKHDNKLRVMYNNLSALFVEGIKYQDNELQNINNKINKINNNMYIIYAMFFAMISAFVYLFNNIVV